MRHLSEGEKERAQCNAFNVKFTQISIHFPICIENIFYIYSIYIYSIYIIYTPPSFHPERGTALYCNWLYSVYNPSILRIHSPYILHLCERERKGGGAQCNAFDIYCCWRRYTANFWSVNRERKHLENVKSYLDMKSYLNVKYYRFVKCYLSVKSCLIVPDTCSSFKV